jgi:hypothetical protein
MAAMMPSINPLTPVTPPPENTTFRKPPLPLPPQLKRKAGEAGLVDGKPQAKIQASSSGPRMPAATASNAALDPKHLAMVSRIAAYYQQRCHAIANYQQQRCQEWANTHRQKCQEMMQAAMLVVAWYIRDRIQRRRRRQKRKFRAGLENQSSSRPKVTRGEIVRRWVMQVPDGMLPPNVAPSADKLRDKEEAEFSMDKEVPPDKDAKLFEMADNLIKSQYRKIDVPIMGALDFDESESESESGGNEDREDEDGDDCDDEDGLQDDDLDDDDDLDMYGYEEDEEAGSEVAHHGTGPGSRSNGRSLSS